MNQSTASSDDFESISDSDWLYSYTAATPAEIPTLPIDATISISTDGSNASVAWNGNVVLQESLDLTNWNDTNAISSPHTDALSDKKFYRLIATIPDGASSSEAQVFPLMSKAELLIIK